MDQHLRAPHYHKTQQYQFTPVFFTETAESSTLSANNEIAFIRVKNGVPIYVRSQIIDENKRKVISLFHFY